MISKDYLLNEETGDLLEDAITGDWVEGESDAQHIQDCMLTEPGLLPHSILAGVGITKQLNGLIDGNVRREIQLQLLNDNYRIDKLDIVNDEIEINATREG